jgi:hypothetical protein
VEAYEELDRILAACHRFTSSLRTFDVPYRLPQAQLKSNGETGGASCFTQTGCEDSKLLVL